MSDIIHLERGDLLCSRGNSWLGGAIRKLTGSPTNHCAMVRIGGPIDRCQIIESDKKVRTGYLMDYHKNDIVWVYRPVRIPHHTLMLVVQAVEEHIGDDYGYLEFLPQAIDALFFGGNVVMRHTLPLIPGTQCSSLIAQALWTYAHETFNSKEAYAASPADAMLEATKPLTTYENVFGEHLGKYVASVRSLGAA